MQWDTTVQQHLISSFTNLDHDLPPRDGIDLMVMLP